MSSRLLLAPAGYGKTESVIQRIRQILAEQPLAPVIAIVPNMIQATGFRQRLFAAGGALGVEIHTFHSLYAELLTRTGQPIPLLGDPVRIRLLRTILADLYPQIGSFPKGDGNEPGKIGYYAALRDKPGFVAALINTLDELKRARIFPNQFAICTANRATKGLSPRLTEIALVYSAYQDWLQQNEWADNEGRGWLAAIALEQNPVLGAETRLVAVSGFDEFNPTQLGVLTLLAQRAQETLITLTGDLQRPHRPAQKRFRRAQAALTHALNLQPEALDSVSLLSPPIAQVESLLFEPVAAKSVLRDETISPQLEPAPDAARLPTCAEGSAIEFVEAQTRSVEARAALRWVKARIVRDGLKLTDVAVFARDLEPYRPFIYETAAEFGIPLRMVGGQPLVENPGVAALFALLSLPAEDWPRRPLLNAWRSPYFDWSVINPAGDSQREMGIALLDEISRQGRVTQGLSQWREALGLAKIRQETVDPETDSQVLSSQQGARLATLQSIQTLENQFQNFIDLLTPPNHATVRQFVAFIEALMGDDPALMTAFSAENGGLNIVGCARANPSTAERDVAALRAFKDVLRGQFAAQIVLTESAPGENEVTYVEFFSDLRAALETATYSVAGQTGLLVASVLDARGLSFEAAVLMGLSEGEFPRLEREDILLRENDRAALRELGLPLDTRLHGDEETLFYQAVTRARKKLLLTRPYLALDGQAWEASPFWEEIYRLSGKPAVRRVRPEVGLDPTEAASPVEWLEAARDFDMHLKNGVEALIARLNPKAAGKYEGDASIGLRESPGATSGQVLDLRERFGTDYGWSASKLESYGTCPFEFFIAHALGLEPLTPPDEGYDVRALGTMLHKILELVYSGTELSEAARDVFTTAPQVYGFRPTPLWECQQRELMRRLRETITALEQASQGYAPFRVEARFGMGEPSLVLGSGIRLHGYIDRLDKAPDGSLRVIDYKAGGAAITAAHLKGGRRLQLPIYALAARDALGLGEVSSGFYWHIQKAEASSLKLEKFEGGVEATFATVVAHIEKHVAGIRAGHFEPKPPADGCPSYCPAVSFCWRYKKGY